MEVNMLNPPVNIDSAVSAAGQHGIRADVRSAFNASKVIHYRFEGRDFLQWSTLLLSHLESFQMAGYLTGEYLPPPAPSSDPAAPPMSAQALYAWQNWKARDFDCKNLILANVARELLYLITPATTAAGMWAVLNDTYHIVNKQSILNLKK